MIKTHLIVAGICFNAYVALANQSIHSPSQFVHYEVSYQESGSNNVLVEKVRGDKAEQFIENVNSKDGTIVAIDSIIDVHYRSGLDSI